MIFLIKIQASDVTHCFNAIALFPMAKNDHTHRGNISEWLLTDIIIQWTHSTMLFSDWPKVFSEFSKSLPVMSSTCRLYNDHVKDTQGQR